MNFNDFQNNGILCSQGMEFEDRNFYEHDLWEQNVMLHSHSRQLVHNQLANFSLIQIKMEIQSSSYLGTERYIVVNTVC